MAFSGQVVSHNLYRESELAEIKTRVATAAPPPSASDDDEAPASATSSSAPRAASSSTSSASSRGGVTLDMYNELQLEVMKLRAEHSQLRTLVRKLADIAGVGSDQEAVEQE